MLRTSLALQGKTFHYKSLEVISLDRQLRTLKNLNDWKISLSRRNRHSGIFSTAKFLCNILKCQFLNYSSLKPFIINFFILLLHPSFICSFAKWSFFIPFFYPRLKCFLSLKSEFYTCYHGLFSSFPNYFLFPFLLFLIYMDFLRTCSYLVT